MDFNEPYDMFIDKTTPEMWKRRVRVLKLKDIEILKNIRNSKRDELATDAAFVPYLYGPEATPSEQSGMGFGM